MGNTTKYPSEADFRLSNIVSSIPNGQQNLIDINDSINHSVNLYNADISDQLVKISNDEEILINQFNNVNELYNNVHNLRVNCLNNDDLKNNKSLHKFDIGSMFKFVSSNSSNTGNGGSAAIDNNKIRQFDKINKVFDEIINESAVQKKRADQLLHRLKNLELKLNKTERLFNDKSCNKSHYTNLFKYGMKNKDKKKDSVAKKDNESEDGSGNDNNNGTDGKTAIAPTIKITSTQSDTDIPVLVSNRDRRSRNSDASDASKISQRKLNQYLDIELQLNRMPKTGKIGIDSTKSIKSVNIETNPIKLINGLSPICGINDETVVIPTNKNLVSDPSELVDELKKLYK